MAEHLKSVRELAVRVIQKDYPLHLTANGAELLPTHLQWLLIVDREPSTGCHSILVLNKKSILRIPDAADRASYAPRIAFFHNEEPGACQCVDFNYLGVPAGEIVHMDKLASKSARILANRWCDSGFDIWTHYQNIWAGAVALALTRAGRPRWEKQVMANFDYDWPGSYAELIFLDLWQHAAAFESSVPHDHAVANNEALGLYKMEMSRICTEATVRDARRRGNDYAYYFAKKICDKSEWRILREKYGTEKLTPKLRELLPTGDRILSRRQSTGATGGLAGKLAAV